MSAADPDTPARATIERGPPPGMRPDAAIATPRFVLRNAALDIEFEIYAWRPLSHEEARHALAVYLVSSKRAPAPGSRVKVFTTIGQPDARDSRTGIRLR